MYQFGTPVEGSQVRFNSEGGGMIVDADENSATFEFWTMSGVLIDRELGHFLEVGGRIDDTHRYGNPNDRSVIDQAVRKRSKRQSGQPGQTA